VRTRTEGCRTKRLRATKKQGRKKTGRSKTLEKKLKPEPGKEWSKVLKKGIPNTILVGRRKPHRGILKAEKNYSL